jgi:small-conductance mechanosensitive channel
MKPSFKAKPPKKLTKKGKPPLAKQQTVPKKAEPAAAPYQALSSETRLNSLLQETEQELEQIETRLQELETYLEQLNTLKQQRQRLLQLKLSLQGLLKEANTVPAPLTPSMPNTPKEQSTLAALPASLILSHWVGQGHFEPELAFQQAQTILKRKDSLNYHLFTAIVLQGGQATIAHIKAYLVQNQLQMPTNAQGFEEASNATISTRVHYLIRKNLVQAVGTGVFQSLVGWKAP